MDADRLAGVLGKRLGVETAGTVDVQPGLARPNELRIEAAGKPLAQKRAEKGRLFGRRNDDLDALLLLAAERAQGERDFGIRHVALDRQRRLGPADGDLHAGVVVLVSCRGGDG